MWDRKDPLGVHFWKIDKIRSKLWADTVSCDEMRLYNFKNLKNYGIPFQPSFAFDKGGCKVKFSFLIFSHPQSHFEIAYFFHFITYWVNYAFPAKILYWIVVLLINWVATSFYLKEG